MQVQNKQITQVQIFARCLVKTVVIISLSLLSDNKDLDQRIDIIAV